MKHPILRGGSVFVLLLASVVAALGQAPSGGLTAGGKIALIDMNTAITRTQEGQQKAQELEAKFAPTSTRIKANAIGSKLLTTIQKYSIDKGLPLVLNVSALPNLSVVFALNELNITEDIVKLYDQEYPVPGSSSSAPAAAPSSP